MFDSEQTRAGWKLQGSEEQYRFLLQSIPQMVWTATPEGALDFVNDRVALYFNTSHEATFGSGWLKWVHPDDQDTAIARWAHSIHAKEPYEIAFRLLRASDNSWRWHLVRAQPVADCSGRLVRWFGTCTDIEDQKRAEAELRQQWQLFDTVLSYTPDFIYTFDLEGRFTYVNAALLALWQKNLAQALGKNFFDLGYPDALAERLQRQIRQVIETKETVRDHTPFTGPNGETRFYEYIFVPVFGGEHQVATVAGSTRDITERTLSAEAVRTSEERLRFALDAGGGVGTWDWDVQNDRVYANSGFAEFYSVAPERAEAGEPISSFMEAIVPEDRVRLTELIQRALKTGEDFSAEYRLHHKDGSLRWVNSRGRCRMNESGAPSRFLGVVFDITAHKQSEMAAEERAKIASLGAEIGGVLTQTVGLRESLQQCAQALVNYFDGAFARIWTITPQGDVLELQASAGLYTHLNGKHARIRVGTFKIGRIAQDRLPHLTNDVANDPWISNPDWARQEGMVAFAGYPLVVEDQLVGVLGLFARHALGQDALRALESISATIAISIQRNRAQEELAKSARELARSNEDLEQFAFVASHDLRSPLGTVIRFTELMLSRKAELLDEDVKRLLNTVLDSANRMADLISALLNYSRLNDVDAVELKPVSSSAAYKDAVANLRSVIEETQARIECEGLPEVLTNPAQLTQVFQNLVSNAINYRGDAVPFIRVSAERQKDFWQFSVSDNGPGIASEYHAIIFEPFKRLHGHDRPGSGIGLAFCRKFVEREGGRIWVESEKGKGATFRFTLPAG